MFYHRIAMNKASTGTVFHEAPADGGLQESLSDFSGILGGSCRKKGKFFIFKHMNMINTPGRP